MTRHVFEGHFHIASLFNCNISYLWHIARSLCICRASCFKMLALTSDCCLCHTLTIQRCTIGKL